MRLKNTLSLLASILLISVFEARSQNSVAIGTNTPDNAAVLLLVGNGSQGLILPVTSNIGGMPLKTGMVVFNSSDKKIYFCDGTTWSTVGGAGSGSTYSLSYDGTTRTITLNPTSGTASISLSTTTLSGGDLSGTLATPTVVKLNGKTLPAFAAGVLTSDASGNLTWSTPSGSLPTIGQNQLLSNDGTNTKAVAVAGDLSLVTGTSGTFTITNSAVTTAKLANSPNSNQILTSNASNTPTWASTISGSQVTPNFGSQALTSGTSTTFGTAGYTWPGSQGTNGTVLTNNGSGVLSWVTPSGSVPTLAANQIISNDGTSTKAFGVGGDLTLTSSGSTASFTVANGAITLPKLANSTSANQILTSNGSNAPTWVSTIPGTQVNPNFGSQAIFTTGAISGSGLSITGSSTKFNGQSYLWPASTAAGYLQTDALGNLSWTAPSLSGTAGGDLTGTYPNPTIANTATTGNNVISSINSASTSINGVRVNPSFGVQALNAGPTTVSALTIGSTTINWPPNSPGVLNNNGTGTLSWGPVSITGLTAGGDLSGTYPNPTIANNSTTGGNIITSINSNASSTINGTRVNASFGNQSITTTGAGAAFIVGGLNAGSSNQFSVNSTGNIAKINNLQANFPGTQGASGSVLTNDGVGNLSWATPTINPPVQVPANTDVFEYTGNPTLRLTINNAVGQYELGKLGSAGNAIFATNWSTGDTYIAGKLGVGVTSPVSVLDVSGDLHLSQLAAPPGPVTDKLYNVGGSLFWNGTNISSGGSGSGWSLTGNAGTTAGTNFIGTTDSQDLIFKTNSVERARLDASGNFGIGTNIPGTILHAVWNAASNINPIAIIETTGASSAAALRFRNASSQSYAMGILGNGDFSISSLNNNVSVADIIRISSTNYVGIGTPSPGAKLDVQGGDINTSGEVNRTSTGAANMVPIAYGSIDQNGNILGGSGNFTVTFTGGNTYSITIAGETYTASGYITNVTTNVASGGCTNNPPLANTFANGSSLGVYVFAMGGGGGSTTTPCGMWSGINFVVYKP